MVVKISKKISYKFFCEKCNYKCNKQSEYTKHLMTAKYKMVVNDSEKSPLLNKNNEFKQLIIEQKSDYSRTC